MYSKHSDNVDSRVEISQTAIGNEKCKQLLSRIANAHNKVSHLDLDKRKDAFAAGIEKQQKITKFEMNILPSRRAG